jgi:hypothetical protein
LLRAISLQYFSYFSLLVHFLSQLNIVAISIYCHTVHAIAMVLLVATIIKCNAILHCNYNMYYNITKISLSKPIAMPLIATTTNESDFVAMKRYYHEYDYYNTISSLQYTKFLVVQLRKLS